MCQLAQCVKHASSNQKLGVGVFDPSRTLLNFLWCCYYYCNNFSLFHRSGVLVNSELSQPKPSYSGYDKFSGLCRVQSFCMQV